MQQLQMEQREIQIPARATPRLLPFVLLLMMGTALLLVDAILPLQGIRSYDALLSHTSSLFLLPTHLLFPHHTIRLLPHLRWIRPTLITSWKETACLLSAFLLLFLVYLLALHYLPKLMSRRFLLTSTLFLGILCLCFPVVTSQDIFSYIAYARIGVIYHLNPLTTWPITIRHDPIFSYVFWFNQPSAYGPVWTSITCFFQWLLGFSGSSGPLRMLIVLRLFGLSMHLCSTLLIWSICGHLQRLTAFMSPHQRMRATLAFAWNPLLLFEACVNAHVDTTVLFLVLLAIWFLVRRTPPNTYSFLLAAVMFALATCVKMNIVLLIPGLLLFLCMQRPRFSHALATLATYMSIIIIFYALYWQGKETLNVFLISPAATLNTNSIAAFISYLHKSIVLGNTSSLSSVMPTPSERLTHTLSIATFVLVYAILCWQAIRNSAYINTLPKFIRWMAVVWLLYCAIGSPWFNPWYLVTFFGLFALIEASSEHNTLLFSFLQLPLAIRILTFSMLSLYCFFTWGPMHTFLPLLPGFMWSYLGSLWIWILPLLALRLRTKSAIFISLHDQLPNFPLNKVRKFKLNTHDLD
jgi:Dolichyl-phosphate-mannose-protein mannosyltransferase